jgi:protein-tyrosine-phosphatase
MADAEGVAPLFIRLADQPLRWRLLTELATGDQRVRELVERVEQPQNLVSYHLRLLRAGGLVTSRRSSYDGRETYYHLDLDRCADGLARSGAALHPWLGLVAPAPREPKAGSPRVLFVCTGNSARSPIAEALLRHRAAGRVTVASAGVSPKERIHPHAVRVLRERFDIDIRDQVPRSTYEVLGAGIRFDRVVTLCDKAREHFSAPAGWRPTHWSVPDPGDASGPSTYSRFVSTSAEIDTRVRHLIPTLESDDNDRDPELEEQL